MSFSSEIESLYAAAKEKLGELPAEVHSFFSSKIDAAKADEAAEQAIRDKVAAEIDHLTSLGYSVVKAIPAPAAPVVGAPIA